MSQQASHSAEPASTHSVGARLVRPGCITYLHIPAADVRRAAAFYRDVFGWKVGGIDSDRPSFDDATGHLSGAWMSDQTPSREPGLLPYIYVEDVEKTASRVVAHGGEIVTGPLPEGRLTVACFRDPAGNLLGLWSDDTRQDDVVAHAELEPELWVDDTAAAVAWYERAFGAEVKYRVGGPDDPDGVVQLSVGGARFWVSGTSEQMGRFKPASIGGATGRFSLIVDDPRSVAEMAVAAGGELRSPVTEEHGWLLGRVADPFGHEWQIGRPLGVWPPPA